MIEKLLQIFILQSYITVHSYISKLSDYPANFYIAILHNSTFLYFKIIRLFCKFLYCNLTQLYISIFQNHQIIHKKIRKRWKLRQEIYKKKSPTIHHFYILFELHYFHPPPQCLTSHIPASIIPRIWHLTSHRARKREECEEPAQGTYRRFSQRIFN